MTLAETFRMQVRSLCSFVPAPASVTSRECSDRHLGAMDRSAWPMSTDLAAAFPPRLGGQHLELMPWGHPHPVAERGRNQHQHRHGRNSDDEGHHRLRSFSAAQMNEWLT